MTFNAIKGPKLSSFFLHFSFLFLLSGDSKKKGIFLKDLLKYA